MYCNNCGKEIDDKAEICPLCGVRLKEPPKKKSPGIAALLSFIITGAGQVYNEEISKGIILFVLEIILALLMVFSFLISPLGALVSTVLTFVVWVYAIYDAYNVAKKINMS